jgi:ATP-dependent Clp protease protease subunit
MNYSQEFRKYAVKGQGISSMVVDKYIDTSITNFTPYIMEERPMNLIQMDVFSRLMKDRIIFLGVPIDDQVANVVVAQLLFLQSTDPSKDVVMYINSPGGSVYAGLAIYDTMQIVSPDVATVCTGLAASMGAVLLCAGAAGKRSGLPHARVMIHQPLGGVQGQASDIEITHREIQKIKKELYEIISKHSGQPYEKIWADSDRDYWMLSSEAKDYGLIDEVLAPKR